MVMPIIHALFKSTSGAPKEIQRGTSSNRQPHSPYNRHWGNRQRRVDQPTPSWNPTGPLVTPMPG